MQGKSSGSVQRSTSSCWFRETLSPPPSPDPWQVRRLCRWWYPHSIFERRNNTYIRYSSLHTHRLGVKSRSVAAGVTPGEFPLWDCWLDAKAGARLKGDLPLPARLLKYLYIHNVSTRWGSSRHFGALGTGARDWLHISHPGDNPIVVSLYPYRLPPPA